MLSQGSSASGDRSRNVSESCHRLVQHRCFIAELAVIVEIASRQPLRIIRFEASPQAEGFD
jgi:hypothetical protein